MRRKRLFHSVAGFCSNTCARHAPSWPEKATSCPLRVQSSSPIFHTNVRLRSLCHAYLSSSPPCLVYLINNITNLPSFSTKLQELDLPLKRGLGPRENRKPGADFRASLVKNASLCLLGKPHKIGLGLLLKSKPRLLWLLQRLGGFGEKLVHGILVHVSPRLCRLVVTGKKKQEGKESHDKRKHK